MRFDYLKNMECAGSRLRQGVDGQAASVVVDCVVNGIIL